uniref:UBX domain-containing protein n=1 Tax=Caenorhabditis tropicalis TaxID=1561998 RepID=A0A1I7T1U5_9PELO
MTINQNNNILFDEDIHVEFFLPPSADDICAAFFLPPSDEKVINIAERRVIVEFQGSALNVFVLEWVKFTSVGIY